MEAACQEYYTMISLTVFQGKILTLIYYIDGTLFKLGGFIQMSAEISLSLSLCFDKH